MNTTECSLHKCPFFSCAQLQSHKAAQVSITEPLDHIALQKLGTKWGNHALKCNILHVTSPNAYSREHVEETASRQSPHWSPLALAMKTLMNRSTSTGSGQALSLQVLSKKTSTRIHIQALNHPGAWDKQEQTATASFVQCLQEEEQRGDSWRGNSLNSRTSPGTPQFMTSHSMTMIRWWPWWRMLGHSLTWGHWWAEVEGGSQTGLILAISSTSLDLSQHNTRDIPDNKQDFSFTNLTRGWKPMILTTSLF